MKQSENKLGYLYRFKSARNILEQYDELEKQIIHFSPREDLNDPLEGHMNLYWNGDKIAWKGLFKNYINCLEYSFFMYRLGATNEQLRTIPIFFTEGSLPTEQYKNLSNEITTEFINNDVVESLATILAIKSIEVSRSELKFFLNIIHKVGLNIIIKNHSTYGLMRKDESVHIESLELNDETLIKLINEYIEVKKNEKNSEELFVVFSGINEELKLHEKVLVDILGEEQRMNWYYLLEEFPDFYIGEIENLIHPPCYMACFSEDYFNPSMWGNYADKHKGICMIFKVNEYNNNYYIPLERTYSYSSNCVSKSFIDTRLEKVIYGGEYININFFEMLGMLNRLQMEYWFKDGEQESYILNNIVDDKWRDKYWTYYNNRYITKTKEWNFEKEYRLRIENGLFGNYSSNEKRNLKYPFDSLEGIIFGIETSQADKVEILKILSRKCIENKRSDFKIYQAYFDEDTKGIKSRELKIIEEKIVEGKYVEFDI